MSQKKIRILDVFEEFLLKYHREELLNILKHNGEDESFSVTVNFPTLFEDYMEASDALLDSPMKLLKVFDQAAFKSLSKIYEEEQQSYPNLIIKSKVYIRLSSLTRCPEIYRDNVPHTCDVNRIICINGTIVRTTSPKMLESQRKYICLKCKHTFDVMADFSLHYQIVKPQRCPNPKQCYSSSFQTKESDKKFTHAKDFQEIKLQEQVQKLVIGTIPRAIWITLEDDLVDTAKPGDDVLICGIVLQRWRSMPRGSRPAIELVVKANNVTVKNKQRSVSSVTDENRSEFVNFWKKFEFDPLEGRNQILASFCPQVYGLYMVKMSVAILVAGGVQKVDANGTRTRGESHLLLVGDPGTGKSQFLKYVSSLVPRCVHTTGIGTTNAGLTAAAVKEGGEWTLEAGALVLADGGVCCIDEFNCVKEHDRAAIHEAMEQQTISVAKAGLVCKLNTRCSILAATNPKGRYDPEEALTVNVALASPLLSRFDLILVLLDSRNADWDKLVSSYILFGKDPLTTKKSDNRIWSMDLLRTYFCHIRTLQPKMTTNANTILAQYYRLQRQTDGRNQARTTIRLLESLIRLSQGHARLLMREEVQTMDALVAISLMETSMCGASLLTGTDALHMAFPQSPKKDYITQAELILRKLGLNEILQEELERCRMESRNQQEFSMAPEDQFSLRKTSEVPPPQIIRSRSLNKHKFIEMDESYDEPKTKKNSTIKKHFKSQKKRPKFSDDEDFEKVLPPKKREMKEKRPAVSSSDEEEDFSRTKNESKKDETKEESMEDFLERASQEIMESVKPSPVFPSNRLSSLKSRLSNKENKLNSDSASDDTSTIATPPLKKTSTSDRLLALKKFHFNKSSKVSLEKETDSVADSSINKVSETTKESVVKQPKSINLSETSTLTESLENQNISLNKSSIQPSSEKTVSPELNLSRSRTPPKKDNKLAFLDKLKKFTFSSSKKDSTNETCPKMTVEKYTGNKPNSPQVDNSCESFKKSYYFNRENIHINNLFKEDNSQFSTSNIYSQPIVSLDSTQLLTDVQDSIPSQESLEDKLRAVLSSSQKSRETVATKVIPQPSSWKDQEFDFDLDI